MRRLCLCLVSLLVSMGLMACGGGDSSASSGSGGGGGGSTVTLSNISLPSSVQVVSAH